MPILTIDAIRENPWNAVYHQLPENPDRLLLSAAYCAAHYCRYSEFELMSAAREGLYTPPGWEPGPESPDVHEEIEARWFDADIRLTEISKMIGMPLETA